jgi:hypothetical protein
MSFDTRKALFALLGCVSLGGCAGDFLWWPGFNPISTAYVDAIPVRDVAFEVQCEIYRFIDNENANKTGPALLDPAKGAGVTLILQTDLSGSVQYTGVDLSKVGFTSLGSVVAASNKIPSLQAKGTGKATVSAEVDFVLAQSKTGPKDVGAKAPANMLIKTSDLKARYQNASFSPVPGQPGVFKPESATNQAPSTNYFPSANCANQNPVKHAFLELWLDDWLARYKSSETAYARTDPYVCNTKVTLKSQFQVVIDVSAGVNPIGQLPIILPISGFNVDASPDFSHSLQISFSLKDPDPKHAAYCSALEGTQPAQVNR